MAKLHNKVVITYGNSVTRTNHDEHHNLLGPDAQGMKNVPNRQTRG